MDADDVVRPEDEPLDDGEPIKPVDDSIPPLVSLTHFTKALINPVYFVLSDGRFRHF